MASLKPNPEYSINSSELQDDAQKKSNDRHRQYGSADIHSAEAIAAGGTLEDLFAELGIKDTVVEVDPIDALIAELTDAPAISATWSNEVTAPEIDRSNEVTADVIERSNKVTDDLAKRSNKVTGDVALARSNKVTKRRRRSNAKDQKDIAIVEQHREPPTTIVSAPLVATPTPSISTLSSDTVAFSSGDTEPLSPKTTKKLRGWDQTDDRMKITMAVAALQVWEKATAWSFNLTPDAIAAALKHPQGFTRSLSRSFNRACLRRLGAVPEHLFVVDVNKEGRLHLHGAMEALPPEFAIYAEIMKEAWDEWVGRGKEHQVDWHPDRCDTNWADYMLKNQTKVRALVGDHTFVITKELRRKAKFIHGEARIIV